MLKTFNEIQAMPLGFTGRRIFWVISFYRGGYALALVGSALLFKDDATVNNAFTAAAVIYFVFALIFIVIAFMEREWLSRPWRLFTALLGDTFFLTLLMLVGGNGVIPLPIFLFPQMVAHSWLLEKRYAFLQAVIPTLFFLGASIVLYFHEEFDLSQVAVIAVICAGYFFIAYLTSVVGRYTKASELLVQQRSIDVANLEQINRTVIRDMKDGVMILDLRGIVRGYNQQAFTFLDAGPYAAAGQRLAQWNAGLYEAWVQWQEAPNEASKPFAVESGSTTLLPRFVRIGEGSSGGALVYLEDLSRARIEAQNLKLAALGRLTASIAHEIRNPLSAIQHATQLLEEDEAVSEENARLLAMIRNNGKRINRIVTEVLQLNRRDRRSPVVLSITDVLRTMVDEILVSEQIPVGTIKLTVDERLTDAKIFFDRGHIDQILWNLLRNAWQFSKKGEKSICVSLMSDQISGRVVIDLVDDGPGIDAPTREQIFEPFFTTSVSGTGLGLYIARELASANQAILELMPPEKNIGAHFRLRIPLAA